MNDTKYLEWCKQQDWFKNHQIIYNICVNQTITTSNQNSKTPQHNKLQNLFLENENVIKLIRKLIYNKTGSIPKKTHYDYTCTFEDIFNWDIIIDNICNYKCCDFEPDTCRGECNEDFDGYKYHNAICIEIKPSLGDDYPCVLRKMKTQIQLTINEYTIKEPKPGEYKYKYLPSNYVLLIKDFNSAITTKEQLISIFNQSNIKIVFIDDLLLDLPNQLIQDAEKLEFTKNPQKQEHASNLEEENKLLREKLLHAEEKIKQLEREILSLQSQKQNKSINYYFGKK